MLTPKTEYIAITKTDGSLAVMQFIIEAEFIREPSDENINAEIQKSNINAVSWRRIKKEDLPLDRTYRNAWKDDGTKIDLDPIKKAIIDVELAKPVVTLDSLKAELEALKAEWKTREPLSVK